MALEPKTCELFTENIKDHFKKNPKAQIKFGEFMKCKIDNPIQRFGATDGPYTGGGILEGYMHAAIANDLRVVYKIKGKNPAIIYLYAVVTHEESGTGTPANIKKQKAFRKRLDNQTFESIE